MVIRVIRLAVEKLSMLANEYVWILSYISYLKLAAKPADAFEASLPPIMPQNSANAAQAIIASPYHTISILKVCVSAIAVISSIRKPIRKGITISIAASPIITSGVRTDTVLYCFTLFKSVLTIQ